MRVSMGGSEASGEQRTIREEQLPRIFQANVGRFFDRVIRPAMEALPLHVQLEKGVAASLEEFLDRAAAQVENYTANEAAKAFTLTLAGVFERQLSIWTRALRAGGAPLPASNKFADMLSACARQAGIDLESEGLGADITQMFLVANVVRHGEGAACEKLQASAPDLWNAKATDYHDLLPGPSRPSETLRIRRHDLFRYVEATVRFWGLADPQPMAVAAMPAVEGWCVS